MAGRAIVFVSMTVLFLGFFMYLPLPKDMTHPWKLRLTTITVDMIGTMSYVVEKVTGKPFAVTFHTLTTFTAQPIHQEFPQIRVEERSLDGIPVRIYRPLVSSDKYSPCIVYFHGGGWVSLNIDAYDAPLVDLTLKTNMVVVAVRYRYAPQHPYPMPFDDCVKATAFLLRSGDTLGIDSKRIAVAGDSAGGNLAAAVSLRLSQEDPQVIPPIKLQVLACPCLQALTFNTTSYRQNVNWYLKKGLMIFFWASYLGLDLNPTTYSTMSKDGHISTSIKRSPLYGSYVNKYRGTISLRNLDYDKKMAAKLDNLVTDPFVAPLMADSQDLIRLPPAYVIATDYDILRDDAVMYAERLKQAGVKTDFWLIKGQSHIAMFMKSKLLSQFLDNSDVDDIISHIANYVVNVL